MMSTRQRGRDSKYTDDFKRQLVSESLADCVSVPIVSKLHGVPTNRIYARRADARFQPSGSAVDAFTPVEVSDVVAADAPAPPSYATLPAPRIEITLEKGRRLSVSDGVDAGFVLEPARGLVA